MLNYKLAKSVIPKKNNKPDLSKRWFIIYSYYSEVEKKFKRFYEYGQVNRIKNIAERKKQLKNLEIARNILLKSGWSPFEKFIPNSSFLMDNNIPLNINNVLDLLVADKIEKNKNVKNISSRVSIFKKYLLENGLLNKPIKKLTSNVASNFIKSLPTSARTKNNYIIDLKSLFNQGLKTNLVQYNPFLGLDFYKTTPIVHETFSADEIAQIMQFTAKHNYKLYLFIKMFTYCFLRPLTITKLKVKNFDIDKRLIKITPDIEKNQKEYAVLIPEILISDIINLKLYQYPDNYFVFTARGVSNEPSSRDTFTNYFFDVKKQLKINNPNKTMYSFRHSLTKDIYYNLRKTKSKQESINVLMDITRHKTQKALEKYLREIGADTPDDYSNLINLKF